MGEFEYSVLIVELTREDVVPQFHPQKTRRAVFFPVRGCFAAHKVGGLRCRPRNNELGATCGVEPLAIVVMAADVQIHHATDMFIEKFLDRVPAYDGNERQPFIGARISVPTVGDIGVMTKCDGPCGFVGGVNATQPSILTRVTQYVFDHDGIGIEANEQCVCVAFCVELVRHVPLGRSAGVRDLVGYAKEVDAQFAIVMVSEDTVEWKADAGIRGLKLAFELWVVDGFNTLVVEVITQIQGKFAALAIRIRFGITHGFHGGRNCVLCGVAFPAITQSDKADDLGTGFFLLLGLGSPLIGSIGLSIDLPFLGGFGCCCALDCAPRRRFAVGIGLGTAKQGQKRQVVGAHRSLPQEV